MKKIFGAVLFCLITGSIAAFATMSSDQINLLNQHFGQVPRQLQLGTLLSTIETTANQALPNALPSGKVWVGQVSASPSPVAVTGDVTISTAGVTTVGAGKIFETMLDVPTDNALNAKRIARFKWDPSNVSGDRAVGAHTLQSTLPAKAIIQRSFFQVKTALVSTSNDGTIAFSCETANNIFSAADIDSASSGDLEDGVSDGALANMKKITSACTITATVAVHGFTAGTIIGWVEYVVSE